MPVTTLITGASSGIGWELARCCAEAGHRLVLVARSEDKLRELADALKRDHGTEAIVLPADLADPASPGVIVQTLQQRGVEVDWLVNNAGFAITDHFSLTDLDRETALLQVNTVAPMALCRLLGAKMVERGSGRILNVASTAAFVPGPFMANYYASKAYLVSFSLALREEWIKHGVSVSVLCPGPTDTAFFAAAGATSAPIAHGAGGGGLKSAAWVARAGFRGMARGKAMIVPGLANGFGALATRLISKPFAARMTKRYNRSDEMMEAGRLPGQVTGT